MEKCSPVEAILSEIVNFAVALKRDDLANCRKMGEHGAKAIEHQTTGDYLATGGDDPELHTIKDR